LRGEPRALGKGVAMKMATSPRALCPIVCWLAGVSLAG
jgi:hypothetical protein